MFNNQKKRIKPTFVSANGTAKCFGPTRWHAWNILFHFVSWFPCRPSWNDRLGPV